MSLSQAPGRRRPAWLDLTAHPEFNSHCSGSDRLFTKDRFRQTQDSTKDIKRFLYHRWLQASPNIANVPLIHVNTYILYLIICMYASIVHVCINILMCVQCIQIVYAYKCTANYWCTYTATLHCTVQYTTLHCIALHYITLHYLT